MKYNINHQQKVIFFWAPKSGVVSLIKLMTYLKFGDRFPGSRLSTISNKLLFATYRKEVFEPWDAKVDYTTYKKVFFGRNPFHRIISCYIDKYVNPISSTPADVPNCSSYIDFLNMLCETGLRKEAMAGRVDFGHFCSVKDDLGWQIYCRAGSPDFDFISLLPDTGLPEGELIHDYRNIRILFELLGVKDKYQSVSGLYENRSFSYDTWLQHEPASLLINDELTEMSREQLWEFLKTKNARTISYESFYPAETATLFRNIYHEEFAFYTERNHTFVP